MPILEENFSSTQLPLIQSGTTTDIFETGIFDETRGDFVKVNVFNDNEKYLGTAQSNLPKHPVLEWEDESTVDLSPQVQIYRDTTTNQIFIKPNEILEYLGYEEGNYKIKFDFLRDVITELQGCSDNRPGTNPDVYGNDTCGPAGISGCLATNYDPAAAAQGDCTFADTDTIIPGIDENIGGEN